MMKFIFISALFLGNLCSAQDFKRIAPRYFSMEGTVTGFADSTWLYLLNNVADTKDSAMIIKNHFKFSSNTLLSKSKVTLNTKDFSDYKFFWIENSAMTFKGEKGKFRQASITGSKTQAEYDSYLRNLVPYDKKIDSIDNLLHKKQLTPSESTTLSKLNDSLRLNKTAIEKNYILKHPGAFPSVYTLNFYATTWGRETVQELFTGLSKESKNSPEGKKIAEFLTINKDLKPGDKFIDFEQLTTDDKTIRLSDVKGKLILLEFWSSDCAPCIAGNPRLIETYNQYKGKGFEILSVSLDTKKAKWMNAIQKGNLPWTNVSDLKGNDNLAALIYGVSAIPDNFLIGRDGIIVARDLRNEKLEEKLEELLK